MNDSKKLKALVVDDDPASVELLSAMLESTKIIECVRASNGADALMVFDSEHPKIVYLDINMPGMDGLQALKKIRAKDNQAKVVMVTASSDINTVKEAITAGAFGYIVKPFQQQKIIDSLKKLTAK